MQVKQGSQLFCNDLYCSDILRFVFLSEPVKRWSVFDQSIGKSAFDLLTTAVGHVVSEFHTGVLT